MRLGEGGAVSRDGTNCPLILPGIDGCGCVLGHKTALSPRRGGQVMGEGWRRVDGSRVTEDPLSEAQADAGAPQPLHGANRFAECILRASALAAKAQRRAPGSIEPRNQSKPAPAAQGAGERLRAPRGRTGASVVDPAKD